jgi:hypothetical protein
MFTMTPDDARNLLSVAQGDEEPAVIPQSVLSKLCVDDVPEGASFQVGTMKDGIIHLDWEGRLHRNGDVIEGEADYTWTRK